MDWTFDENKVFENVIGELGVDCPNLFQQLASKLPEKSINQIQEHYEALVRDVEMIESGQFDEAFQINGSGSTMANVVSHGPSSYDVSLPRVPRKKPSYDVSLSRVPRKKPSLWTNNEQEAFIRGLEEYGKGDWKSISRYCVQTRTPTQIASHAQKYFQKLQRYAIKQQDEIDAQIKGEVQPNVEPNATD